MNDNESWDKKVHNELVSQGLSWEHARIAVGIMAEQRQLADREGYDRGFNDGHKKGMVEGHDLGYGDGLECVY